MNKHVKAARVAAMRFQEASEALDKVKDELMPFAEQQIEITKKVIVECNMKDSYTYKPYFHHDWIELEVNYDSFRTDDEALSIHCDLWYHGRCGDPSTVEGGFTLSEHILNGQPEKFESELRANLETETQKKARQAREDKERQLAKLQKDLAKLQEELK